MDGRLAGRSVLPSFRRPVLLGVVLALVSLPLHAQGNVTTEMQRSRQRLDSIRAERERLEAEQERLRGQVRDVGAELRNIERQRETTNRIVNEIEGQIGGLNTSLEQVSAELVLAEDNLAEKRAVLDRRLVEIYKRGPLYTFQALLAAESFGNLLARYKYLFLSSNQDRQLVTDVEGLRNRVGRQRRELLGIRTSLDFTRAEREASCAVIRAWPRPGAAAE
jgi:peptidoglycan hydrolase CwlO-like protein